ncbi:hypothetical protein AGLY_006793 [Aphis glycines]|uniref:Uncharacterized protein n=1 Tax=Aphis glycines TaxID=307491 RepID=A0A6G0TQ94_APHGL|nr:hypothetical protein AGLY_006793 [Aphis glycines]
MDTGLVLVKLSFDSVDYLILSTEASLQHLFFLHNRFFPKDYLNCIFNEMCQSILGVYSYIYGLEAVLLSPYIEYISVKIHRRRQHNNTATLLGFLKKKNTLWLLQEQNIDRHITHNKLKRICEILLRVFCKKTTISNVQIIFYSFIRCHKLIHVSITKSHLEIFKFIKKIVCEYPNVLCSKYGSITKSATNCTVMKKKLNVNELWAFYGFTFFFLSVSISENNLFPSITISRSNLNLTFTFKKLSYHVYYTELPLKIIALHLIESCNKANHYNYRIKSLYQVHKSQLNVRELSCRGCDVLLFYKMFCN